MWAYERAELYVSHKKKKCLASPALNSTLITFETDVLQLFADGRVVSLKSSIPLLFNLLNGIGSK